MINSSLLNTYSPMPGGKGNNLVPEDYNGGPNPGSS